MKIISSATIRAASSGDGKGEGSVGTGHAAKERVTVPDVLPD